MSLKRTYASARRGKAKVSARARLGLPLFLSISAIVLVFAGFLLVGAFSSRTPVAAAGVIDLRADMSGFNKTEIRVKVGEPVTIRLTSLDTSNHTDGGGQHQWAVDEFAASVIAPAKGSKTMTFTPDKPGEFI